VKFNATPVYFYLFIFFSLHFQEYKVKQFLMRVWVCVCIWKLKIRLHPIFIIWPRCHQIITSGIFMNEKMQISIEQKINIQQFICRPRMRTVWINFFRWWIYSSIWLCVILRNLFFAQRAMIVNNKLLVMHFSFFLLVFFSWFVWCRKKSRDDEKKLLQDCQNSFMIMKKCDMVIANEQKKVKKYKYLSILRGWSLLCENIWHQI
jgi:hypothetical protein